MLDVCHWVDGINRKYSAFGASTQNRFCVEPERGLEVSLRALGKSAPS